jgi:hypothetical protein
MKFINEKKGWVVFRPSEKERCFWVYGTKKEAEEWTDPDDIVARATVTFEVDEKGKK